jgi:hypothetical protein
MEVSDLLVGMKGRLQLILPFSMMSCNLLVWRRLVNIPPQANGRGTNHELVIKKLKPRRSQPLGEYICGLTTSGDKPMADIFVQDLFPNKVVVDLDMLGPGMVERIRC